MLLFNCVTHPNAPLPSVHTLLVIDNPLKPLLQQVVHAGVLFSMVAQLQVHMLKLQFQKDTLAIVTKITGFVGEHTNQKLAQTTVHTHHRVPGTVAHRIGMVGTKSWLNINECEKCKVFESEKTMRGQPCTGHSAHNLKLANLSLVSGRSHLLV